MHLEYKTKKAVTGLAEISAKNEILSDSKMKLVDYYLRKYQKKLD